MFLPAAKIDDRGFNEAAHSFVAQKKKYSFMLASQLNYSL